MKQRIDETDLLGWIEGDLPPDRRALVEAEMARDGALRRRLEAMASDRRALRTWMQAGSAPAGLVADAIEEAERMALVGEAPAPIRIAWYRSSRVLMAASLLIAVGGVSLTWMATRPTPATGPASELFATTPPNLGPESMASAQANDRARVGESEQTDGASKLAAASTPEADMGDAFPLEAAMAKIDAAGVSGEDAPRGVLSLPLGGGGRWAQTVGLNSGPKVTSATYADALRLASVGRLTVRVQAGDGAAIEQALRSFGSTGDHGFEMLEEDSFGTRFAVEMDRTECEFARLVEAIEVACGADCRAFFDVTLLPAMAARNTGGFEPPRQVSGAAPRVNIQVLVEPDAGVKW